MGFRNVPGDTPDDWALSVLAEILGSGQSSRLYQSLVKEKELAVSAAAFELDHRGPSLFQARATVRPGKNVKDVEAAVLAEIERMKTEPVADWELRKAQLLFKRSNVQDLQSTLERAVEIGEFAVFYNDPDLINTMQEKIEKVTKEDIQRVARQYLTAENRAVVISVPKPKTAASAGGSR
jgi:predicted Zn-dependent peptidase